MGYALPGTPLDINQKTRSEMVDLSLIFQRPRFLKLFKRLRVGSALPGIRVYWMYIGQQATAVIAKL